MVITKKHLPRRTFLRGMGVTLALPLLDSMVPAFTPTVRTAAKPTRRLGVIYLPNGIGNMPAWTPPNDGVNFQLSPILEPLAPFRHQLLVLSGLKANWNYIHAGASGSFLTGTTRGSATRADQAGWRWVSQARGTAVPGPMMKPTGSAPKPDA